MRFRPDTSTRRAFLKGAGAATVTALTIGFEWAGPTRARRRWPRRIGTRHSRPMPLSASAPTTASPSSPSIIEMGQGAYTGIATMLAEELDADWAQVRVESAPADAKRYANLAFGKIQGTGGSSAMANSWPQLRDAGAKARAMLLTAAAEEWHVPVGGTHRREKRGLPRSQQDARRPSARWSKAPRHCRCPKQCSSRIQRTSS